jgi:hypothetical protein
MIAVFSAPISRWIKGFSADHFLAFATSGFMSRMRLPTSLIAFALLPKKYYS